MARWITYKGRHILIDDDGNIANNKKEFNLTDENINQIISESVSEWDEDYARLYLTKISPDDFLKLTASERMMQILENEKFDSLDINMLENKKYVADMMYLDIDMESGQVLGHEGRHRMMALKNEGYDSVEIVVFPRNYQKYNAREYRDKEIYNQEGVESHFSKLDYLMPVSKRNIERVKNREYM